MLFNDKLNLDGGLRVVEATFQTQRPFDWSLFSGYDSIKILTYSAGVGAIVRLLNDHDFTDFECVFGSEKTLRNFKTIMAFQATAIRDARAAIKGLPDHRHAFILERIRQGQARFRVLRKEIAHSKLYLLSDKRSERIRVLVGSANLSETAFGGEQSETLVKFDNDQKAWEHYLNQYIRVLDDASNEIELPKERVIEAEISLRDIPALSPSDRTTLVIDTRPGDSKIEIPVPSPPHAEQAERIKAREQLIPPSIAQIIPAAKDGRQRLDPAIRAKIRTETTRVREVKTEDARHSELSIDISSRSVTLNGQDHALEWDKAKADADARLMLDFFANYEGAFEGGAGVERLQRDYFIFWSWLYFSPFMCDQRNLADAVGDIFQYPSFAIIYGKSNCGKSSLVDTLITSMFGNPFNIDKRDFTKARLRGIRDSFKRFPVIFDDIGRTAISAHGSDVIKDENLPPVSEYPCFALSMNSELNAFPDEIIKRCLMIYTTTALPSYREDSRSELHMEIRRIRSELSDHFYREYLSRAMDGLTAFSSGGDPLLRDWLAFSSGILSDMLAERADKAPAWSEPATWNSYADRRHDRVKSQLANLLRPARRLRKEAHGVEGWRIEDDRVVVFEQTDTFGRSGFDWKNVPSTLIDEDISVRGRTALDRREVEAFLGTSLDGGAGGALRRFVQRAFGTD